MSAWLNPLRSELEDVSGPVPFFFRDDDAGWGDVELLALLDVFAARATRVDLAVIPHELDVGLARELATRDGVGLHQHGLAHADHEPEGRKCEFGPARDAARQRADIAEGRERLRALLGDRLDPIFTPPWNRCTLDTGRCLAELGFRVLSREARAEPLRVPGLLELPVCVDWVRLDPYDAGARIGDAIGAGGPVGVMFHHAVMDAASLARAGDLVDLLASHDSARPAAMLDL